MTAKQLLDRWEQMANAETVGLSDAERVAVQIAFLSGVAAMSEVPLPEQAGVANEAVDTIKHKAKVYLNHIYGRIGQRN